MSSFFTSSPPISNPSPIPCIKTSVRYRNNIIPVKHQDSDMTQYFEHWFHQQWQFSRQQRWADSLNSSSTSLSHCANSLQKLRVNKSPLVSDTFECIHGQYHQRLLLDQQLPPRFWIPKIWSIAEPSLKPVSPFLSLRSWPNLVIHGSLFLWTIHLIF